jgi:hypothetical protein
MENDNDLREMFRELAEEDAAIAPALSRQWLAAERAKVRGARLPFVWYPALSLAAAGAVAAILLIAQRPAEPELVELPGPMYTAPSDFLLNTPGSDFVSSLPDEESPDPGAPTAALPRRDSSEE